MRKGVAPDHMATAPQIAELRAAKKARPVHIRAGHEEVAAPTSTIQTIRDRHRARAAIIERENERRRIGIQIRRLNRDGSPPRMRSDGAKVLVKLSRLELVTRRVASRKTAVVFAA